MLDMNTLDFQSHVLAASVLAHFFEQETVEKVSGKSFVCFFCFVLIFRYFLNCYVAILKCGVRFRGINEPSSACLRAVQRRPPAVSGLDGALRRGGGPVRRSKAERV